MKDYVLIVDDFLTHEECDRYIEIVNNEEHGKFDEPLNYSFHSLFFHDISDIQKKIVELYSEKYPEIQLTPSLWGFDKPFLLKRFYPKKSFNVWHCEHDYTESQRIACSIIYLSDHNCGTEFYDGSVVMSKKGRIMIFPTFWTHMHRGQVCPENKDRYIISGYISFLKAPDNREQYQHKFS